VHDIHLLLTGRDLGVGVPVGAVGRRATGTVVEVATRAVITPDILCRTARNRARTARTVEISGVTNRTVTEVTARAVVDVTAGTVVHVAARAVITPDILCRTARNRARTARTVEISGVTNRTVTEVTARAVVDVTAGTVVEVAAGTVIDVAAGTIITPDILTRTARNRARTARTIEISGVTNRTVTEVTTGTVVDVTARAVVEVTTGTVGEVTTGTVVEVTTGTAVGVAGGCRGAGAAGLGADAAGFIAAGAFLCGPALLDGRFFFGRAVAAVVGALASGLACGRLPGAALEILVRGLLRVAGVEIVRASAGGLLVLRHGVLLGCLVREQHSMDRARARPRRGGVE